MQSPFAKTLGATPVTTVAVALFFQRWTHYESRQRALQFVELRAANRAQSTANGAASRFRRIEMMGADLAARLHCAAPQIPIILISGFPKTQQLEKWLSQSIAGFLQKPFRRSELGSLLASLGASRRPRAS